MDYEEINNLFKEHKVMAANIDRYTSSIEFDNGEVIYITAESSYDSSYLEIDTKTDRDKREEEGKIKRAAANLEIVKRNSIKMAVLQKLSPEERELFLKYL